MNQYQIFSMTRHVRYMFFIDINYPYDKLIRIIHHNQRIWGGRYNPIVPVKDGLIVDGYLDVIKHYDPDFIFYSKEIDPELLKRLRLFNPSGYYNLDETPRGGDLLGVDALYFVSQFEHTSKVLMPGDVWKTESPLLEYYETNFGLTSNGVVSDYEITKRLNQIKVTTQNFSALNQIIHEQKPINQAHLSRKNLNTKILRSLEFAPYNATELVISRDKNSNQDLLYFWNRQLYQCHNIIYLTVEDLSILTDDKFFGGVLYDLSAESTIDIVSSTLTTEEIKLIIEDQLNKIAFYRRFQHKKIEKFPFDVLDEGGLFEREYGEETSIQSLLSNNNLFIIPKLSFTDKVGFYPQKWAVDIQVKKLGKKQNENLLHFPLTTDTRYIVKEVNGRITKKRHISFYIHNQLNTSGAIEINIPEFPELLNQLIRSPIFQGTELTTKYVEIALHDSSNKLNSFIRAFNSNFNIIDEFFTDKFWVDIFERLCTSEKAGGESILFQEILDNCIKIFHNLQAPLETRETSYRNPENLSLGLQRMLKTLTELGIFLLGFKLKCPTCSSIFWYHIKDVGNKVSCKGCLGEFNLPIELSFAYKLNDLIKNNIFQSKTQRDGNLTVIRTLISLGSRLGHYSFDYSPQINLYSRRHAGNPTSEIDIVALVDGKLVIGEAKHNSKEFSSNNHKSLDSLIEVAKAIFPDKVVLACYEDEHSRLDRARKYLEHHFKHWDFAPEIDSLLLHKPDYFKLKGSRYFYY